MSTGEMVRRTVVRIVSSEAGSDADGTRGFLASRRCALGMDRWLACHLPPLAPGGPHRVAIADLRANPPVVSIESAVLEEGGAAVITGQDGPRLVGGSRLPAQADPALGPPEYIQASWHAPLAGPEPLFRLARIRGTGRWSLEAYDTTNTARRWKTGGAELPGDPIGIGVQSHGAALYLTLGKRNTQSGFELIALDADGATAWRVPLGMSPTGLLLPSADGGRLAVLARDPARCESCLKIVIVSARDGSTVLEAALAADTIAESATSAGLSGDTFWVYRYVPAHTTSELAPLGRTRVGVECNYELYDLRAASSKPLRTLRDATGDWKDLTNGCEARSLIPLADGHVAAVRVVGEDEITVVEFDAAP